MKKLALLLTLLLAGVARGQTYTAVTATALDVTGNPFVLGNFNISLINTSGLQPQLGGNPTFQKVYSGTLTTTGTFPALVLPSNAVITPAGTQWQFQVCANPLQISGIFPAPVLPCFTYNATISGATQTITMYSANSIPLIINGGSTQSETLLSPLLSNAVINSISCSAGTCTVTCDQANCGVTGTPNLNLGLGLPVGCADLTGNVTGTSGNTLTFSGNGCTANSGTSPAAPFYGQIGQVATPLKFLNAASLSSPNTYSAITQTADAHTTLTLYNAGVVVNKLDLQSSGPAGIGSNTNNISFGIGTDSLNCAGQPWANLGGTCSTSGYDNTGNEVKFRGFTAFGHSGQVYKTSGAFSGNHTNTNFYTSPASGIGGNSMYHLQGYFQCNSSCATGTLFVTVSYTDQGGNAASQSTCTVQATNMNCVGTTAAATTFGAAGGLVPFDMKIVLGNTKTISLTTTTTNTPVGVYFYQLFLDNN